MKSPYNNTEMKLLKKLETLTYKNESIEIELWYYLDDETNDEFEDEVLSHFNYNSVLLKYYQKHYNQFSEIKQELINFLKIMDNYLRGSCDGANDFQMKENIKLMNECLKLIDKINKI